MRDTLPGPSCARLSERVLGPGEETRETARVHHDPRWCGGSMAIHQSRTAEGDVGNWVCQQSLVRRISGPGRSLSRGSQEKGFVEGNNLAIAFRWAEGHYDRLPALCVELVRQGVAVLVAAGGPPSALAAKAATVTTPIVFILASDPIKLGLVASLNHPGSNATGVALFAVAVEPKKLEILHELVPKTTQIGVLVNPRNPNAQTITTELQTASGALGL